MDIKPLQREDWLTRIVGVGFNLVYSILFLLFMTRLFANSEPAPPAGFYLPPAEAARGREGPTERFQPAWRLTTRNGECWSCS